MSYGTSEIAELALTTDVLVIGGELAEGWVAWGAAAMLATARWMYRSGLQRTESRGMHKRLDYPEQDANQQHYWFSGGLDHVWVRSALDQDQDTTIEKELALR